MLDYPHSKVNQKERILKKMIGGNAHGKKRIKIGLIPKLIIAIILGILFGSFMPE